MFGAKLQTLMASVGMYSRRLGMSITTDARGLSFVFTHIDPKQPQRKFELLLGYDENKAIKSKEQNNNTLSRTPYQCTHTHTLTVGCARVAVLY